MGCSTVRSVRRTFGLLGGRAGSLAAFVAQIVVDAFAGRLGAEEARKLAEIGRLAMRVRVLRGTVPGVLAVDDAPRNPSSRKQRRRRRMTRSIPSGASPVDVSLLNRPGIVGGS